MIRERRENKVNPTIAQVSAWRHFETVACSCGGGGRGKGCQAESCSPAESRTQSVKGLELVGQSMRKEEATQKNRSRNLGVLLILLLNAMGVIS